MRISTTGEPVGYSLNTYDGMQTFVGTYVAKAANETITGTIEKFDNDESCTITATLNPSGSTPSQERPPRKRVLGEAVLGAALLIGGLAAFIILSRKAHMEPRSAAGWIVAGMLIIWTWAVPWTGGVVWGVLLLTCLAGGTAWSVEEIFLKKRGDRWTRIFTFAAVIVFSVLWGIVVIRTRLPHPTFVLWAGGLLLMFALAGTVRIIEAARRKERSRKWTNMVILVTGIISLLLLVWEWASEVI